MTYHSNPFDKQDCGKFAFKKAELLRILQGIDKDFSFDVLDQEIQEYCEEYNNDVTSDYSVNFENKDIIEPPLFYLNDTFTLIEASCLLSGDNPIFMSRCFHDTNFDQNYPSFNEAFNFINAAVWAGKLPDNGIPSELLKTYLQSKGKIIIGFNDHLSEAPQNELLEKQAEYENRIANLELDIAIEKSQVEQLKKQLQETTAEIAKLKASQAAEPNNLIEQIFDESAKERYAPDLVLSIKLWESIYIHNPKDDSHSNKANNWISLNTGYGLTKPSAAKLREITTPFINWSTHRDKNYQK